MNTNNVCEHGVVLQFCPTCRVLFQEKRRQERLRSEATAGERKSPLNSETYFDHSWKEWFEMRDAGAALIFEHARQRKFLTYPELWAGIRARVDFEIGNPWRQVPHLLGYISECTFEEIGLFVTALIVDGDAQHGPSEGFFRLAADRGALPEADSPPKGIIWTGMSPRQKAFWESQVERIFAKSDQI
jgi:hypothetical protein